MASGGNPRAVRMANPMVALLTLAAACGGGAGPPPYGGGDQPSSPSRDSGAATTLGVVTEGGLGPILVDEAGRTVYMFEEDRANTSTCSGECASAWPPVTTSAAPQAADAAKEGLVGTTSRENGDTQVTYKGHPLYYYGPERDTKHSAEGAGLKQFGGEWYALSPQGTKTEKDGGS